MEKMLLFLLIVGSLIGIGIILSFYGAQLATQNLTVKEEDIVPASSLEISVELSTSIGNTGVYGILVNQFEDDAISITISDPSGTAIISKIIEKESTEDRFEILSSGNYKLVLENSSLETKHVVAGIGYMPDSSILSVGLIGLYLLIGGLIGIGGVGVYAVRNRRKKT